MGLIGKKKKKSSEEEIVLPPLEFKPKAPSKAEVDGIMIAARQLPGFPIATTLLAMAMVDRADIIMLDFTQTGVAVRFRVDGIAENKPPLERETGDAALVALKRLASLNPADRRSKQEAKLPFHFAKEDWIAEIVTQGVPTGERVMIRIEPKKTKLKTLSDLGMRDKLQEEWRGFLNATGGIVIVSGPPGHGLPTSWRISLESADKFVRDFVGVEDKCKQEPEIVNVSQNTFDSSAGEAPSAILRSIQLKQPDVYVIPDFVNDDTAKFIIDEITIENRHCITRLVASDAAEALCKFITQHKSHAPKLISKVTAILNVRLVRRLCDKCKQAYQPTPQLLQRLGLPADRVKTLYQPFIPPPPEQRVDAKGNPIEIEICQKCAGRGYYGRMGIYEVLKLNDNIRKAALQNPSPEAVRQVAKKEGHKSFQEEGLLAAVVGHTSLQELQRVLTPPAKPGAK